MHVLGHFFLPFIATLLFVRASVAETWACSAANKGFPQELSIELDGDKIIALDHLSMAPAGDGTFLSCSIEAHRTDGHSTWTDDGTKTTISLKEGAAPEDTIHIQRAGKTVKIFFDVSPSNCGHSTPLARTISISKGRKQCHAITLAD